MAVVQPISSHSCSNRSCVHVTEFGTNSSGQPRQLLVGLFVPVCVCVLVLVLVWCVVWCVTVLPQDRPFAGPPFRRTAQNFALCFPSPASLHFRSFSLSLGVFLWNFGGLKRRGPEMCTFGVLRLSCEAPFSCRAEGWIGILRLVP